MGRLEVVDYQSLRSLRPVEAPWRRFKAKARKRRSRIRTETCGRDRPRRGRDFEGLHSRNHLWSYQAPSLNDLYFAHVAFFEAVLTTSRACNKYLACCCRAANRTIEILGLPRAAKPESALRTFKEQYEKLRENITNLKSCWETTEGVVAEELRRLQGNQWMLRDDLPTFVTKAKLHCDIFGAHYQSLEEMVKRVDSAVRAGTRDAVMSRDAAHKVMMEGSWFYNLLLVFTDYKLGLGLLTGRTHLPDHTSPGTRVTECTQSGKKHKGSEPGKEIPEGKFPTMTPPSMCASVEPLPITDTTWAIARRR
ncbi:hypothetical protein C8R47DRAFT_1202631 [Mycena vitilis]|nr:hypothetical protein C8R47DRAFT_1202631 [Mycena vitilis]